MADSTAGRGGEKVKETARQAAADVQAKAREQLATTGERTRQTAEDTVTQMRTMVRDAAEQQKHRAAAGIQAVARSLHDVARTLTDDEMQIGARYTDMAAEQLEWAADTLERRSMDDLAADVASFARRQPAVFVGGAFALGFLAARFLKSTEEPGAGPREVESSTSYTATTPLQASATETPSVTATPGDIAAGTVSGTAYGTATTSGELAQSQRDTGGKS